MPLPSPPPPLTPSGWNTWADDVTDTILDHDATKLDTTELAHVTDTDLILDHAVTGDTYSRIQILAGGRFAIGRGDVPLGYYNIPAGPPDAPSLEAMWSLRVNENINGLELIGGGPDIYAGFIRHLLVIRDYLGAPILWTNQAGLAIGITDNFKWLEGDLSTPIFRMMYRGEEGPGGAAGARVNPAFVIGQIGDPDFDSRDVGLCFYHEDPSGNPTWVRFKGDWRCERTVVADVDGTITVLGAIGPGSQGGLKVANDLTSLIYRIASGRWRTPSAFESEQALVAGADGDGEVRIGALGPTSEAAIDFAGEGVVYLESPTQLRTAFDLRSEGNVVGDVDGGLAALGAVGPASQAGTRFGGDTRWYRDSANVMRTDDAVVIDTDLTVGDDLTVTGDAAVGTLTVGGTEAAAIPRSVNVPVLAYFSEVGTWAMNGTFLANAGAQNDELSWEMALRPGTYTLRVVHSEGNDRGILTVYVDGNSVGTIDLYAAATATVLDSLAGITVPASATNLHTIRVVLATKNASSSSYKALLQGAAMLRTGA